MSKYKCTYFFKPKTATPGASWTEYIVHTFSDRSNNANAILQDLHFNNKGFTWKMNREEIPATYRIMALSKYNRGAGWFPFFSTKIYMSEEQAIVRMQELQHSNSGFVFKLEEIEESNDF